MFPSAKHFVSKDQYHNYFDATIPPAVRVDAGDMVHVETIDCYHGKLQPEENYNAAVETLKREELNPVSGPIYVNGAEPGDWLAVTLHDIRPTGVGVACCGTHSGQLCHLLPKGKTYVKFFDLQESKVTMRRPMNNDGSNINISFPSAPMLGVIGVAPPSNERILTMPAGSHGGNLDNKRNGIGAIIYLPVNHPGALLSIGDMHASQGDGEIAGTGVEIGGNVLLSCQIIPKNDIYPPPVAAAAASSRVRFPVTETLTHWITHGVAVEDIPHATRLACEDAAAILTGQWGLTIDEAFVFLSVHADLGLCQSCHPDQGTQIAKVTVPKLPFCPRPFRILLPSK
mmetsp:Transcript_28929/g.43687  ORF Transcript_28929/g.43687 Transcript_28929/m.43687 type:complete len:342 (-) Transcript_28929:7-1032(-)